MHKCESCGRERSCGCAHHSVVPITMIVAAIIFLLGGQGYLSPQIVDLAWPILLGFAGIAKLSEGSCGCC